MYSVQVLPGLVFWEPAQLQNMEHEVSAVNVLHDKEQMVPCLETGVEACQKWWLPLKGQDLALIEGTLHVILLHDEVLLETLDGIHILGGLVLCQEYLQRLVVNE